jgi:leucyl-tRNA synthetase
MNPVEYEHIAVEQACKQFWNSAGIYRTDGLSDKPKYYVWTCSLTHQGAGLHVGHPLGYISSDIVARKRRMEGYHVLHPWGSMHLACRQNNMPYRPEFTLRYRLVRT